MNRWIWQLSYHRICMSTEHLEICCDFIYIWMILSASAVAWLIVDFYCRHHNVPDLNITHKYETWGIRACKHRADWGFPTALGRQPTFRGPSILELSYLVFIKQLSYPDYPWEFVKQEILLFVVFLFSDILLAWKMKNHPCKIKFLNENTKRSKLDETEF